MKSLQEFLLEARGWGGSASPMGQRKIDWKKVIGKVIVNSEVEKFLKDNGIPTTDLQIDNPYKRYSNSYMSASVRVTLKWDEAGFKKWASSKHLSMKHNGTGVGFLEIRNAEDSLNLNAFSVAPGGISSIEFYLEDYGPYELNDVTIQLYWESEQLMPVIDEISPKKEANLPNYGTPGGENDGVGRKILVDDIVAVMPRTGNASNRTFRLARVLSQSGKRFNVLLADGNEVALEGELMIIVQRGNIVVQ